MHFGRVENLQEVDWKLPQIKEEQKFLSLNHGPLGIYTWSSHMGMSRIGGEDLSEWHDTGETISTIIAQVPDHRAKPSFYHLPTLEQVEQWCALVPEGV